MQKKSLLDELKETPKSRRRRKLSREEIGQAVEMLDIEDVKLRFSIGEWIADQGDRSLAALKGGMKSDKPEIRRSAIFLMGKILKKNKKKTDQSTETFLQSVLTDEDPKVRKNAVLVLSAIGTKDSSSPLISALEREVVDWIKPSMILALGAIGGDAVRAYLQDYHTGSQEEAEALRKALDRVSELESDVSLQTKIEHPLTVELWTFQGLERILEEEAKERLNLPVQRLEGRGIRLDTQEFDRLFELRCFSELLFPIGVLEGIERKRLPEQILGFFSQNAVLDHIHSLHRSNRGKIRFRLEVRGKDLKHAERKEIVRRLAMGVPTLHDGFFNSPSHYDVELRLMMKGREARLLWKPYTLPDHRFSYRKQDVPASIHPVTAAALARLSLKAGGKGHRVLDPFCGSGTLLIEKGLATTDCEMVGVDIASKAIEAAKANISAAALKNIRLVQQDMRKVDYDGAFDEIISNAPFGIRVGDHDSNEELYHDFFKMLSGILKPGGLILFYTQEIDLTTRLFRKYPQLKLVDTFRVDAGGLRPAVFIGKRI